MIIIGNCKDELKKLKSESINCCVTSPPYFGLRDYGHKDQLGLEKNPADYVKNMVKIFREVKRVLKDDGTLWLNLGDSYNNFRVSTNGQAVHDRKLNGKFSGRRPVDRNLKEKDLIGIPWRVALALQEPDLLCKECGQVNHKSSWGVVNNSMYICPVCLSKDKLEIDSNGWYLRQDIIWSKPNPMPESVRDRCTKSHEYIFLLSKNPKYFYDHEAIKETATNRNPGNKNHKYTDQYNNEKSEQHRTKAGLKNTRAVEFRNKRSVWTVSVKQYREAHFATFPPDLIKPCILAGCPEKGIVLDPFFGSGTVGQVAKENGRDFIGIELNPDYKPLIEKRIQSANYQLGF